MPKKSEDAILDIYHADKKLSKINEKTIKNIIILLKNYTGHDFSFYKESTITRRTKKRMYVHQFDSLNEYYKYIKDHPKEVNALFNDLLINVTSFFRDSNAFDILEKKLISEVLDKKANEDKVRIWIPGCSTGEEVYSIAIIIHEYLEKSGKSMEVQILGTDIDDDAISTARSAIYSSKIADDITPERLHKFFIKKDDSYKVKKKIRKMAVFAIQDIITGHPFNKLDAISCRNVLIYLNKKAQNKILSSFIYALKPDGILFLGPSESLSNFAESFITLDSKWKIYKLKEKIRTN